jgi:uridine phosphorylase
MVPLYHLGFKSEPQAEFAILPGDPGRVEELARRLDNPRFFAQNREYTTWICENNGRNVLVMSTGMGGPSAAIAVEELAQCGVHTLVRIGTCGGMAERVRGGDIVVATAAIRAEGTSREYVPIEFPAVADIEVTNALIAAAKDCGTTYHAGVVHCKDSFYGQHSPERMPVGYELQNKWSAWLRAGALASEMESAAVFTVAQTLGLRAGCVLGVLWNQERRKSGLDDADGDAVKAADVAVAAVRKLLLK